MRRVLIVLISHHIQIITFDIISINGSVHMLAVGMCENGYTIMEIVLGSVGMDTIRNEVRV